MIRDLSKFQIRPPRSDDDSGADDGLAAYTPWSKLQPDGAVVQANVFNNALQTNITVVGTPVFVNVGFTWASDPAIAPVDFVLFTNGTPAYIGPLASRTFRVMAHGNAHLAAGLPATVDFWLYRTGFIPFPLTKVSQTVGTLRWVSFLIEYEIELQPGTGVQLFCANSTNLQNIIWRDMRLLLV